MFWPSQNVVLSSTHVNEESHFESFTHVHHIYMLGYM